MSNPDKLASTAFAESRGSEINSTNRPTTQIGTRIPVTKQAFTRVILETKFPG